MHKIPDFKFVNQNNELVTNKIFEGKIYIADFFFTSCPGICSKLTKNMSKIQETYKKDSDIILLSLTVMPWRDSVPLLWEYAQNNNVDVKNGI
ncbi:SCO family protein [Seonamhaeicola aphaedonensis]|nr:SCO family protein [Seonamhaeicola aphaedonensis]